MKKLSLLIISLIFLLGINQAFAQGGDDYTPLTLKLDDEGKKYIRFLTWHQFWMDVNNREGDESSADFRVRRSRVLAYAQVTPDFLILTHFGINNQDFDSGGALGQGANGTDGKKPQLFMHDVWAEYRIVDKALYLGTGLHYWNGVSRLTNSSTLNFMTMDAPIFNWTNIEHTDQFARQMGIYAKGKLGKLDYRIALNKPFQFGNEMDFFTDGTAITTANYLQNDHWATQGYLCYQFLDQESNKLPYFVGTYLGTKKVFNIGAGWYNHAGAVAINPTGAVGDVERQDVTQIGVDAFLDLPLNDANSGAISAYAVYYNFNYGDNYTRGTLLGTGDIIYGQVGYMFPQLDNGAKIQPYAAFANKSLDGLEDNVFDWKAGINYFIEGHHAKITLEYSDQPVFDFTTGGTEADRFGVFRLQTHIFL